MIESRLQSDLVQFTNNPFKKSLPPIVEYFNPNGVSPTTLHWWIEVTTNKPFCIYYFGPFDTMLEAASLYSGYIEDLRDEGVPEQEINAIIKLCQPYQLTVFMDESE